MTAVTGPSANRYPRKDADAHTSPTVLRNLFRDIAELKTSERQIGERVQTLELELQKLRTGAAGEEDADAEMRELRKEIRALKERLKATEARLEHKEEQLEAVRKGREPGLVDHDAKRRAEAEEADRDNPYVRLLSTDLSSLNET